MRRTKEEIEADRLEAFNQLAISGGFFEVCKKLFVADHGQLWWRETMVKVTLNDFIEAMHMIYVELKRWFRNQKVDVNPMKQIDFKHFQMYYGDSITFAIVRNELERIEDEDQNNE